MSFGDIIFDFLSNKTYSQKIEVDEFGHSTFKAFVEYSSKNAHVESITNVNIVRNGYGDGKVSLVENEDLNASRLKLDFRPGRHHYQYNTSRGNLTINGVNGDYTVRITPV